MPPAWVYSFYASERLGCSVPEVDKLPTYYRDRALMIVRAEHEANRLTAERAKKLREMGF